jgi:rRNA maturation endonuclease Nob1
VDEDSESVSTLEALGQKYDSQVMLCSAKTGENVEAMFKMLADLLVADVKAAPSSKKDRPPQTLSEVVDFIVQDFCAQYGDLEKAMLIVQHQFESAGVDIRKPQKEAVLKALDGLAKAEELSLSKTVARVNLEERQRMVILARG